LTRGQETELPASAKITYISSAGDYRQAVSEARRLQGASGRVSLAEVPLVLEPERGSAIAETWLFESWAARERAQFSLPPSALAYEPGDTVVLSDAGSRLVRLTDIGDHGARDCEARSIDPDVYGAAPSITRGGSDGYAAAFQAPWPGAVSILASPETTGYVVKGVATSPAVTGTTLDPIAPGPLGVLDWGHSFRVELADGELASVSNLQVLAGQNLAAVRMANGTFEVIQFQSATLVAPRTYRINGLLRAQYGTDAAMAAGALAGARFVLLTEDVARIDLTLDEMRLPLNWRYGPSTLDIGDASYASRTFTFGASGLRPYSPAYVKSKRLSNGDIAVSWARRTRIGGDSWDSADVPLSEDTERYELDVLSGAIVKRTIAVTAQAATYTQAQQVADFGSIQPSYAVKLYQLGTIYGRGTPRSAAI
jgi:Putative phage tail protein